MLFLLVFFDTFCKGKILYCCFVDYLKAFDSINRLFLWYKISSYQDFLDRGLLLTKKLLNQGFLLVKLKSSTMTWLTVMEYLCHK